MVWELTTALMSEVYMEEDKEWQNIYIYRCKDTHKLALAPKNLNLVSAIDASYTEHPDGKSHSRGVVGFESDTSCYFCFLSSKQPVVTKSVGEAGLIAHN
jgi:hypothetical protein